MSLLSDMRKCYDDTLNRDSMPYDMRMVRLHPDTIEALKAKHGIDGTSLCGFPIIPDKSVGVGHLRWDYSKYAEKP